MRDQSIAVVRPGIDIRRVIIELGLIVVGSAVVALGAQLAVPLPFTPVPVTLQTLAVLLVGVALGWRRGGAAIILYLVEGAAGLPVFAGGAAGAAHLFGATGGYLFGFVAAAALVGWLAQRGWCRHLFGSLMVMTAGTVVIFAFGLTWLAAVVGIGSAINLGLVPFIPGAILKVACGAGASPVAGRLLQQLGAMTGHEGDLTE